MTVIVCADPYGERIERSQGLLDKDTILELMDLDPPLVEHAVEIDLQIQPNGIDLTLQDVAEYASGGVVDFSNANRKLPLTKVLPFDPKGILHLEPGSYMVTLNEVVNLPKDLAALGRTRSTLLRCGVALHTAVWDAGYSGRSQSLMTVYNPDGFTIHRNARIMQLVFFQLKRPVAEGYKGLYLRENI